MKTDNNVVHVHDAQVVKDGRENGRFTPQEILDRIEDLKQTFEPEPSLLQQLLSSADREHAAAIAKLKVAKLKATQEYVERLTDCIKIYVDVHKGDLRVRGSGFIIATFEMQMRALNTASEEGLIAFFDNYADSVSRIDGIDALTPEMKIDQKRLAYERANANRLNSEVRFKRILDEIGLQVEKLIQELGH